MKKTGMLNMIRKQANINIPVAAVVIAMPCTAG